MIPIEHNGPNGLMLRRKTHSVILSRYKLDITIYIKHS
jgi:hypothetical protein